MTNSRRLREEAACFAIKYYPGIHIKELRKTANNIILFGFLVMISTEDVPHIKTTGFGP
jgi:hypothetical protein